MTSARKRASYLPMKLHLSRSADSNQITGYGPDHVLVNGVRHESSLIVLPDEVVATWVTHFEALSAQDFDVVLMRAPEIVLLGSGARLRFPSPALYAGLLKARIGVEVMDTAAACRTFNILAAEGRRVAAALIL
jgi:uncharacterized protein